MASEYHFAHGGRTSNGDEEIFKVLERGRGVWLRLVYRKESQEWTIRPSVTGMTLERGLKAQPSSAPCWRPTS